MGNTSDWVEMDGLRYVYAAQGAAPMPAPTDNPACDAHMSHDVIARTAQAVFGIRALFPWQRLVIANILDAAHACTHTTPFAAAGSSQTDATRVTHVDDAQPEDNFVGAMQDTRFDQDGVSRAHQVVLLPTGAGKSLYFQVPALFLEGPTLVVYPLLSLMRDQCRRMQAVGFSVILLRGGLNAQERAYMYAQLDRCAEAYGRMRGVTPPAHQTAEFSLADSISFDASLFSDDVSTFSKVVHVDERLAQKRTESRRGVCIIASPEILTQPALRARVRACRVAHLVIDEAHCVSEWGDSFRPDYVRLGELVQDLAPQVVTAFTATASQTVLARIMEVLFGGRAHVLQGTVDRPNIRYTVRTVLCKQTALTQLVARCVRPAVIFCARRVQVERVAHHLRTCLSDTQIRFYHAGLQREEKETVERWFHTHDSAVLVTTCAWGMGVDKPNVRTVIHVDAPLTVEAYVQEVGRAGRDGMRADAFLLWSPRDARSIETLPHAQRVRAHVLRHFAESGRCRRAVLLESLGEQNVCAGCDVCAGTARFVCEDVEALLQFLKKNARRFTVSSLVQHLALHQKVLSVADVRALLYYALETGRVKKKHSLLWGDVLYVAR